MLQKVFGATSRARQVMILDQSGCNMYVAILEAFLVLNRDQIVHLSGKFVNFSNSAFWFLGRVSLRYTKSPKPMDANSPLNLHFSRLVALGARNLYFSPMVSIT